MVTSSYTQGLEPFRRTFQVPELASIIYRFSSKGDYVNLLYLSREFYNWLLPIIWEDVDLIHALLLVPGARDASKNSGDPIKAEYCTTLGFASPVDLTRFNIHAPLIKTVRTEELYDVAFPSTWPSLGSPSNPNPLFPNLQCLVVNSMNGLGDECLAWWCHLFTPGLLEFRMLSLGTLSESEFVNQSEECPGLGTKACLDLIDQLSRNCPRLERLRLYPADYVKDGQGGYCSLYGNLTAFTNLRSFSLVVSEVHSDVFEALGQLPHLENLVLRSSGAMLPTKDPITVPDKSFPCLRALSLYGLDEDPIVRICKITPLFRHLVSAEIITDYYSHEDYPGDYERSKVAVESMGENSPHLRNITIHPRGNFGSFVVSAYTINAFRCMPLTSLNLGMIDFDTGPNSSSSGHDLARGYSPTAQWTTFLATVPQLEQFYIEQQELEAKYLWQFATHLPNLRLLVIGGTTFDGTEEPSNEIQASQPILIRTRLQLSSQMSQSFLDRTLPNTSVPVVARFVISSTKVFLTLTSS
ncbi:hypothetical protein FRC12_002490 [Ceratobasidium sp. 428]|nr:hypothetical protein FRC12_002490 [Ceratobasidium sp. 428]